MQLSFREDKLREKADIAMAMFVAIRCIPIDLDRQSIVRGVLAGDRSALSRLRVRLLLRNGEDQPCDELAGVWEAFTKKIPEWGDPGRSFVFFRDVAGCRLVTRKQVDRKCAFHGAVLVEAYTAQLDHPNATPLDVTKVLLMETSPEVNYEVVLRDNGTSSYGALGLLVGERFIKKVDLRRVTARTLRNGPLLVKLNGTRELRETDQLSFTKAAGTFYEDHCAVILGTRLVKLRRAKTLRNGKQIRFTRRFLLQHAWLKKQFFEMNLRHLWYLDAGLWGYQVRKGYTRMGGRLRTRLFSAEGAVDSRERAAPERVF
jgi:hypothetical protein